MATSQNGFPVKSSSAGLDKTPIGNTGVTVPGGTTDDDCGFVLRYVAEQFHNRVEKLRQGWCWGYAYRPVRGQSTGFSNHASATALDLNAPNHPMGKANTFSAEEKAEIHKILAEVDGVVRWGGDYHGRIDEMHFEINDDYNAVKAVAAKLRKPKPVPADDSKYGTYAKVEAGSRTLTVFDAGDDVKKLQFILNRWYGNLNLTEDGYFGPATEDGVKYMQGRARLEADGVVGRRTWTALNVI